MIKKILLVIVLLALFVFVGGLLWFRAQFAEAGAQRIDSLTQRLASQSLLFVAAHPDDEQLVTGLLVQAEREKLPTFMITATKGEHGQQYPVVARKKDLGTVREAETLKNSFALGVGEHEVHDFPDGLLNTVPYEELVDFVHSYLVKWQPDTVATFWPESGFSRHSDHMLMGRATRDASAILRENPVAGYAGPDHIAYPLAPRNAMRLVGGERGRWVAAHQPEPHYTISGEGWAKIRGWKIHASQARFVQADYGLPSWFVHRIWNTEHYHVESLD